MLTFGDIKGPFLKKAQAAEYCGYTLNTWKNMVESVYDIPRHGPKKNRYACSVLDLFMSMPDGFRKDRSPARRRTPLVLRA